MTPDIVCKTCGLREGVFLVLRSASGTIYRCQACDDHGPPEEINWGERLPSPAGGHK